MNCKCCHCLSVTFSKKNFKIIILTILVLFLVFLAYKIFSGNLNKNNKEAYSTLFVGFGAIVAAVIAFLAVEKQIQNQGEQLDRDRKRRGLEYKIQTIGEKVKENEQKCAIAKAILADINALINRIEYIGLADVSIIKRTLEAFYAAKISCDIIRIEENYFLVFETLIRDVAFMPTELVSEIFNWYTSAKGYIETLALSQDNIKLFQLDIEKQAATIAEETNQLIESGVSLIEKLKVNLTFVEKELRYLAIKKIELQESLLD